MKGVWWSAAALACALPVSPAWAGAWGFARGEGQLILKYETASADEALDPNGVRVAIPYRRDEGLTLFVERGLGRRLTLQGKASYGQGVDAGISYEGAGPAELGLRAEVYRTERTAVSLYVGGIKGGSGRNATYAPPGVGDAGGEVRLFVGRSGVWRGRQVFAEAQVARIDLSGLPAESRFDTTLGIAPKEGWLVLLQSYSGQAGNSRWRKGEVSVVKRITPSVSTQVGWRMVIDGQDSPLDDGLVIGLWKKF